MAGDAVAGLSRRERQIMDVLFARGGATVSEILEALPDPPSYSAVRATLRILEEKGHAKHEQDGPRYVYRPTVGDEAARRAALKHVVGTYFHGSVEEAAVALLRMADRRLTAAQLDALAAEVERARREGR